MTDPLARPQDRELLDQFRRHWGLRGAGDLRAQLGELARAFACIPYENLTKIVKEAASGSAAAARRTPQEVLADHQRWRSGGTCFSLTATLLHLVRSLGLRGEPILADRRYGTDTHCAMIVWLEDQPHLLDPGYLIVDPVPLTESHEPTIVETQFNQLELAATAPERVELYTRQPDDRRYRLTFKTAPVDETQFRQAWDASFDWDMMQYPLLTMVSGGRQLYMRGGHLQRRSPFEVEREVVPDRQLAKRIGREFGIHSDLIRQALAVLRRRGN